MNDPDILAQYSGPLRTRIGGAFPGKRAVFRGQDLHRDLKDASWLDLFLFGITGRRLTPPQLKLLDAIWAYTSYPDARLWNNRIAALAGTSRSTAFLGIAAAIAGSEASIFGGQINLRAADFLTYAQRHRGLGESIERVVRTYLAEHRSIPGYGRPIRRMDEDERIRPTVELANSLGLGGGQHLRLAFAIEDTLSSGRWRMRMNYGALTAALSLDLGLTPEEHYLFSIPAFLAGMPPCYDEAKDRAEGGTFPLRCDQIQYAGVPRREWHNT